MKGFPLRPFVSFVFNCFLQWIHKMNFVFQEAR